MHKSKTFFFLIVGAVIFICSGCGKEQKLAQDCLSLSAGIAQSPGSDPGQADYETYAELKIPPLHPDDALKKFQLEEGFRIELVAHEPMVIDPIAMDIDADGRLWVVNMPSYNRMPVREILATTGERTEEREAALTARALEEPADATIVVLEDTSGDGKMDKYRVFFEGLQRPLAIKVLVDGVLVGEPPNLWFIRDSDGNGKGDVKELVSGSYGPLPTASTQGGTNGLTWGLDNWIYSTHFPSLRRVDGKWKTRPFEVLGQWGLSQDNWGRLYSTNNSWPLQAHLVPHGYSERNPRHGLKTGKNVRIAPNGPLWPAHPTAVNRGYRVGTVTREDGTLQQATGVASTMIYRGDQFGEDYVGNAFTPEPAGNLIKRLIIEGDPAEIKAEARFAYEGREFLTSTDERFRPVNIYNAPDGSIYVVDMYRGLYDYMLWITDYLRDYAFENEMDIPTGMYGRIYRIVREGREVDFKQPKFSELTPSEVVEYLRHNNGWLRDQAQQVLVQCPSPEVVPPLIKMAVDHSENPWTRLHALWTLEGFPDNVYERQQLNELALQAFEDPHPRIRAAAVRILEPELEANSPGVLAKMEELSESEQAPYVRLQMLASLGESGSDKALQLIASLLNENVESPYFREMALTAVYQREEQLAYILRTQYGWNKERGSEYEGILVALAEGVEKKTQRNLSHLTKSQLSLYELGEMRFVTCIACHGAGGEGINGIGAKLAGSKWVEGEPEALVRILLHGFDGGAAERGENIPNDMPGHAFMSDKELAGLLTYIRQSWGNNASPVAPGEVNRIREESSDRKAFWTPDELRVVLNGDSK